MHIPQEDCCFLRRLKKLGCSDQLMKQYRNLGWLIFLSKGIMYPREHSLSALTALATCEE